MRFNLLSRTHRILTGAGYWLEKKLKHVYERKLLRRESARIELRSNRVRHWQASRQMRSSTGSWTVEDDEEHCTAQHNIDSPCLQSRHNSGPSCGRGTARHDQFQRVAYLTLLCGARDAFGLALSCLYRVKHSQTNVCCGRLYPMETSSDRANKCSQLSDGLLKREVLR